MKRDQFSLRTASSTHTQARLSLPAEDWPPPSRPGPLAAPGVELGPYASGALYLSPRSTVHWTRPCREVAPLSLLRVLGCSGPRALASQAKPGAAAEAPQRALQGLSPHLHLAAVGILVKQRLGTGSQRFLHPTGTPLLQVLSLLLGSGWERSWRGQRAGLQGGRDV